MNHPHKWWILAVVQLGVLLCSIDGTIVLFALPVMAADLKITIGQIQWVSIAYTITAGATLGLTGKLADLMGRKSAYLTGFAIFTVASVVSGLVSDLNLLIALRAFTAIGTAFLLSSSNVIITSVFPREQHGLALGIGATVFSVGFGLGLSLGAFILHIATWRWIFLINLPFGVLALIAGALIFDPKVIGQAHPRTKKLDLPGAFFLITGVGSLLLGLQLLTEAVDGKAITLLATFVAAVVLFIIQERRAQDPIIPLGLFRIREISLGSITRIIMRMAGAGTTFTLPFYLQRNLGLTPATAGSLLLAYVIIFAIAGPLSGYSADRFGARKIIIAGLSFLCLGVSLHLLLPQGQAPATPGVLTLVIIAQATMGLGAAMFGSPNTSAAMQAAPREMRGVASGLLWTTSFMGQACGAALAGIILNAHSKQIGGPLHNQQWVFGTLAVLLMVGILLSFKRTSIDAVASEVKSPA